MLLAKAVVLLSRRQMVNYVIRKSPSGRAPKRAMKMVEKDAVKRPNGLENRLLVRRYSH